MTGLKFGFSSFETLFLKPCEAHFTGKLDLNFNWIHFVREQLKLFPPSLPHPPHLAVVLPLSVQRGRKLN